MPKYIHFIDQVTFNQIPDIVTNITDSTLFNSMAPVNGVLRIKIAATHSGKITKNNGFYQPSKMKDGVKTWTDQYNKPILVHHNDEKDSIGRVVSASYVDISSGFLAVVNSNKETILCDSIKLTEFNNGSLLKEDNIKFINDYFVSNSELLNNPDYQGLGYIELIADISDPDAIQKFLDKRYLTGSVGLSTDSAICSICDLDWADDDTEEICEHRPGRIYDGKKCVLIAGNLFYREWSPVNNPADTHSTVLEIINSVTNDIKLINITNSVEDSTVNNNGGENMEDDNKGILSIHLDAVYLNDIVNFFTQEVYDNLVGDDSWGKDYAEMLYCLYLDTKEEDKETVKQNILDAKLSSAQRKSMSSSSFCGPNRSFPIPDCAHVTAAKRLIGRYKGPGDKTAIMSCVNRKAKRLGCKSDDSVREPTMYLDVNYFDQFSDNELLDMLVGLDVAIKERELILDKTSCSCDSQDNLLKTENEQLNQLLIDKTKDLKDLYIENIYNLDLLANKKILSDNNKQELLSKSVDNLKDEYNKLSESINKKELCDIINSGLVDNKVIPTIENPTLVEDNNNKKLTQESKDIIRLEWLKIRTTLGEDNANKWLSNFKLIPNDLGL